MGSAGLKMAARILDFIEMRLLFLFLDLAARVTQGLHQRLKEADDRESREPDA